jgi:hypothetical protein
MTTASEFREYAKECLAWACEAETEDQRQSWTLAALRLEGVMIPGRSEQPSAATPER